MLGVVEALRLLTSPGDTVVVNCPVYPPFFAFLETAGLQVREAPLTADSRLDLDALAEAMAGPATAYLLCNPHNPTGTVHTADELAAVAALADEHGVRVVADEIHAPLVLPGAALRAVPHRAGSGRRLRRPVGHQGLEPRRAQGRPARRRTGRRRRPRPAAGGRQPRPEPPRRARPHRGAGRGRPLAGRAARRPRPQAPSRLRTLLDEHLPGAGWTTPEATYLAWLDCRPLGLGADDDGRARPGDVAGRTGRVSSCARRAWRSAPGRPSGRAAQATSA